MAADKDTLMKALRNADAAGDTDGAKRIAAMIKAVPQEAPKEPNFMERMAIATLKGGAPAAGMEAVGEGLDYLSKKGGDVAAGYVEKKSRMMGASQKPEDKARREAISRTVGEVIPSLAATFSPFGEEKVGLDIAREAPEAVKKAISLGYKLKPSEAGGKLGAQVESLSGSARVETKAAVHNQTITNNIAAKEIGLPEGTKLTKSAIQYAKRPHNAVYDEVGKLGEVKTDSQYVKDIQSANRNPGTSFPEARNADIDKLIQSYSEPKFDAKDGILAIRQLRAAASKNIKAFGAPERNELGYAQKRIADAIEGQISRFAESRPEGFDKPGLGKRFADARQALAKINSVSDAVVNDAGDVSAHHLAKQLTKGVPLSGGLKDIAEVSRDFPYVTRDISKLKNRGQFSVFDEAAAFFGGGGAIASGHPAVGGAVLAGIGARPAARAALLSDFYQQGLTKATKANRYEELAKLAPGTLATGEGSP